jgi:hypothetical protein
VQIFDFVVYNFQMPLFASAPEVHCLFGLARQQFEPNRRTAGSPTNRFGWRLLSGWHSAEAADSETGGFETKWRTGCPVQRFVRAD